MFIKLTQRKNGSVYVRIAESFWENKSSRQKTLMSLGSAKTKKELAVLKKKAQEIILQIESQRNPPLPGMEKSLYKLKPSAKASSAPKREKQKKPHPSSLPLLSDTLEQARVIQGISGVCGAVYDQMNFHTIIQETYKDRQWNEYLKACVLSRVAEPRSKRGTARMLEWDYDQKIPLDSIYRMMDRLYVNENRVKSLVAENTLSLFRQKVDILFFDVTTLYFESFTEDDLRCFGYSKDQKFKETQVVLALVTNFEGHPLSYELFSGNTSEGKTLISAVESLKKNFSVRSVVLVADRAMFSEPNLEFMNKSGFQYIVAAKLKSFSKERKEKILSQKKALMKKIEKEKKKEEEERKKGKKGGKGKKFGPVMDWEELGKRWIVSYSSKRAAKARADRERLIDKLLKQFKKGEVSAKSLMSNHGTKKYISVDKKAKARLNKEKIEEDARWDGLHGVVTNIRGQAAQELLSRYKGLWKIEEAFRVNKHTLKMRPIYHWTAKRIRAHIAICFLAYSLSFMMRYRLERAGLKLSIEELREILKRDQYSIIEDQRTGKRYRYPSKFTEPVRKIYEAFGLKRVSEIKPLS